jgi:hypothetical protein
MVDDFPKSNFFDFCLNGAVFCKTVNIFGFIIVWTTEIDFSAHFLISYFVHFAGMKYDFAIMRPIGCFEQARITGPVYVQCAHSVA